MWNEEEMENIDFAAKYPELSADINRLANFDRFVLFH